MIMIIVLKPYHSAKIIFSKFNEVLGMRNLIFSPPKTTRTRYDSVQALHDALFFNNK